MATSAKTDLPLELPICPPSMMGSTIMLRLGVKWSKAQQQLYDDCVSSLRSFDDTRECMYIFAIFAVRVVPPISMPKYFVVEVCKNLNRDLAMPLYRWCIKARCVFERERLDGTSGYAVCFEMGRRPHPRFFVCCKEVKRILIGFKAALVAGETKLQVALESALASNELYESSHKEESFLTEEIGAQDRQDALVARASAKQIKRADLEAKAKAEAEEQFRLIEQTLAAQDRSIIIEWNEHKHQLYHHCLIQLDSVEQVEFPIVILAPDLMPECVVQEVCLRLNRNLIIGYPARDRGTCVSKSADPMQPIRATCVRAENSYAVHILF